MAIVEDPEGYETDALNRVMPSFAGLQVLEIGCGDGRLTRRYARDAASVMAIDPDEDAIALLRSDLPSVDARAIGIEQLSASDHSVDLAVFAWSL
jgi:2-polyprenyl-3-methyl-5-hydroxy-6-metoxy-1,4-benzoquinol methylase